MRGVIAILRPKERAILSIWSKGSSSGKRKEMRTYPGRKRMNGNPRMVLQMLSGIKAITKIKRVVSRTTMNRSQGFSLIFTLKLFLPTYWIMSNLINSFLSSESGFGQSERSEYRRAPPESYILAEFCDISVSYLSISFTAVVFP